MKTDSTLDNASIKDIFKRLLTPLWLRPERALWDAHELFVARKFLSYDFTHPSLEYGCTDGIPSFVMLGGEFKPSFDEYREVSWGRESYKQHAMLKSDYFEKHDPSRDQDDTILRRPQECFEYGVSWKPAHIQKASRLELYKQLICKEFGEPLEMLEDRQIATIFAPNLFWIEENKLVDQIKELRRILAAKGRIITIFPDISQRKHLFYTLADQAPVQWRNDIDRGIHLNLTRHARSLSEWTGYFSRVSLRISRHEYFIPSLVSQVYQIGFRPMFPVFMNMYEKLLRGSESDLLELKKHWIETAYHFFSPLCDVEWMVKMGMDPVWHIFELRRAD